MTAVDKEEQGKLLISAAKSLKRFQLADSNIALYLHAISEAGRLGLFASAVKAEKRVDISRVRFFAGQEGINPHNLTTELLPWMENAGLCSLMRDQAGDIKSVTSLILTYHDLLRSVSNFYESRNPSTESRASIKILMRANSMPTPETVIREESALEFGEETANLAINLPKTYKIVDQTSGELEPLLYAPRVWINLDAKVSKALAVLDPTERQIIRYFIELVKTNQGYPENILRREANQNQALHLLNIAIGVSLINKTELHMTDGTSRSFLTTPHFYSDLADEFGEDMCDRVKIFLDSIRNGQYFGSTQTGRIFDPERLLKALLDLGAVGPATAISTDYLVAEKAGIIHVQSLPGSSTRSYMHLRQPDTVQKVLEIVSSGTIEPNHTRMRVEHISDGGEFRSIEQSRAPAGQIAPRFAELEYTVIRSLREA